MRTYNIAIVSDLHLDAYGPTQSDLWLNNVVPDINNNVKPDLVIGNGDIGPQKYWEYGSVRAKLDQVTIPSMYLDGNHEWDYLGIPIDKNGQFVPWNTKYPFIQCALAEAITDANQVVIKPTSLAGFSAIEDLIVAFNTSTKAFKISHVDSINEATGEIILTQGFGLAFTDLVNTVIIQGRDRASISAAAIDFLLNSTTRTMLSQTRQVGNNLLVLLSTEDFFERPVANGLANLSGAALHWLKNILALNQDKNIFVFCHFPVMGTGLTMTDGLGTTGTGFGGTNSFGFTDETSQNIKDLLTQHHVCAWISGHSHLLPMESGTVQHNAPVGWGGCTFIHCPSTGAQGPAWGQVTAWKPYWRMLQLTEDSNTALITTRDSDLETWISFNYDISVALTYAVKLDDVVEVRMNRLLPLCLGAVKVLHSRIKLPIYSDELCIVLDPMIGKLAPGQVHIIDKWIVNNTAIPIAVQLYDENETEGKVTYSWNGATYADPTAWHSIDPGEKHIFKVKVDLATATVTQTFAVGKRVKAVI